MNYRGRKLCSVKKIVEYISFPMERPLSIMHLYLEMKQTCLQNCHDIHWNKDIQCSISAKIYAMNLRFKEQYWELFAVQTHSGWARDATSFKSTVIARAFIFIYGFNMHERIYHANILYFFFVSYSHKTVITLQCLFTQLPVFNLGPTSIQSDFKIVTLQNVDSTTYIF